MVTARRVRRLDVNNEKIESVKCQSSGTSLAMIVGIKISRRAGNVDQIHCHA